DGHLALREVELGQRDVVVAHRGDAQGVGNGAACDAQVRGAREIGPDRDLRPDQAGCGGDVADTGDGAQLFGDGEGGFIQRVGVIASQTRYLLIMTVTEAGAGADARDFLQRRSDLLFTLLFFGAFGARL